MIGAKKGLRQNKVILPQLFAHCVLNSEYNLFNVGVFSRVH